MRWMVAVVAALLFGAVRPASAQFFDTDNKILCWSCYSHNAHFAAGVALDRFATLGLFAPSWRGSVVGRVAIAGIAGTAYEVLDFASCRRRGDCGRPDSGFGVIDIGYVVAGAVATELVMAGVKKLVK